MADKAAKDGIFLSSLKARFPQDSFFPHISKLCMEEWQDSWDSTSTNKLFSIRPVLGKTNRVHHYAVVTKQSSLG